MPSKPGKQSMGPLANEALVKQAAVEQLANYLKMPVGEIEYLFDTGAITASVKQQATIDGHKLFPNNPTNAMVVFDIKPYLMPKDWKLPGNQVVPPGGMLHVQVPVSEMHVWDLQQKQEKADYMAKAEDYMAKADAAKAAAEPSPFEKLHKEPEAMVQHQLYALASHYGWGYQKVLKWFNQGYIKAKVPDALDANYYYHLEKWPAIHYWKMHGSEPPATNLSEMQCECSAPIPTMPKCEHGYTAVQCPGCAPKAAYISNCHTHGHSDFGKPVTKCLQCVSKYQLKVALTKHAKPSGPYEFDQGGVVPKAHPGWANAGYSQGGLYHMPSEAKAFGGEVVHTTQDFHTNSFAFSMPADEALMMTPCKTVASAALPSAHVVECHHPDCLIGYDPQGNPKYERRDFPIGGKGKLAAVDMMLHHQKVTGHQPKYMQLYYREHTHAPAGLKLSEEQEAFLKKLYAKELQPELDHWLKYVQAQQYGAFPQKYVVGAKPETMHVAGFKPDVVHMDEPPTAKCPHGEDWSNCGYCTANPIGQAHNAIKKTAEALEELTNGGIKAGKAFEELSKKVNIPGDAYTLNVCDHGYIPSSCTQCKAESDKAKQSFMASMENIFGPEGSKGFKDHGYISGGMGQHKCCGHCKPNQHYAHSAGCGKPLKADMAEAIAKKKAEIKEALKKPLDGDWYKKYQHLSMDTPCTVCGKGMGKHQAGTLACPVDNAVGSYYNEVAVFLPKGCGCNQENCIDCHPLDIKTWFPGGLTYDEGKPIGKYQKAAQDAMTYGTAYVEVKPDTGKLPCIECGGTGWFKALNEACETCHGSGLKPKPKLKDPFADLDDLDDVCMHDNGPECPECKAESDKVDEALKKLNEVSPLDEPGNTCPHGMADAEQCMKCFDDEVNG